MSCRGPIGRLLFASALGVCLLSSQSASSQEADDPALESGVWRAWLDSPGGELPFGLCFAHTADGWRAWFLNGLESIPVPEVRVDETGVVLDITHYDSRIQASLSRGGTRLDGTWRKRAPGKDAWSQLPFHAAYGMKQGFGPLSPEQLERIPSVRLAGGARFAVKFASDDELAVLDLEGPENALRATILTTTGDYRYLAGDYAAGTLRLSCFDGAHAFLFLAEWDHEDPDVMFRGDFWSRDSWHDTWTAVPDPEAGLPDAFGLTRWQQSADLSKCVYPDLDGQPRRLDDEAFEGRARILYVFGSWCPNCHDCTEFLVELHREYAPRGLSVVGLAFEFTEDFERDARQVRRYRDKHGVEWPLLLAGPSDKTEATKHFPVLDRIRSYPTTIFMTGGGEVVAVHQGFTGPATGEAYDKLRADFRALLEDLLGVSKEEGGGGG